VRTCYKAEKILAELKVDIQIDLILPKIFIHILSIILKILNMVIVRTYLNYGFGLHRLVTGMIWLVWTE